MSFFLSPRSTIAPLVLLGTLTALVQPAYADSEAVGRVAQEVTVRIEVEIIEEENDDVRRERIGSGSMIAFQDGTYYVLTAAHVVRRPNLNYIIVTPDERNYTVSGREVIRLDNVDMAIIAFEAPSNRYTLARFGNPDALALGSPVYASGWPSSFTAQIGGQFVFAQGSVSVQSNTQFQGGYELGYSSSTIAGMSGGPVLNNDGLLVAMHGVAEGEEATTSSGDVIQVTGNLNWGIPITTFTELAPEAFIRNAKFRMENGDYGAAIADFSQGLFFNPNSANALVGRAFAQFAIGRDLNDVIDDASNAIRLDSNNANARAYLVRGAANAQLGRHNSAIDDFRNAIPGLSGGLRVVALSLQARSYSQQEEIRAAITTATDAVNTLEHPFAYSSRAFVREANADIESADRDKLQAQLLIENYSAGAYEAAILSQYDLRVAVVTQPTPTPGSTPTPRPTPTPTQSVTRTPTPTPIPTPSGNSGDLRTLFAASSTIETLAMSPTGSQIAAGLENGGVYFYSQGSGRTLNGHSARVRSIAFSPDGNLLASGDVDGVIQLWNTRTGQRQGTLNQSSGAVSGLVFSRSGATLLAGGLNGKVEQYTMSNLSTLRAYTDALVAPGALAMSYGGQYMAAGSGRILYIWDVANGQRVNRFNGAEHTITGLEYLPDDSGLVVGDSYGNVSIWDLATQTQSPAFDTGWEIASLALSPDRQTIVIGGDRDSTGASEVSFWDFNGNRATPPTYFDNSITSVLWLPDGRVLAGSKTGEVFIVPSN